MAIRYVEYIESTGTQYIDTGIKPTQNIGLELVVSDWGTDEISTTLYGTQSASSDRYDLFITTAGAYRTYFGGGWVGFDEGTSASDKVTITRNGNVLSIGNASVTSTDKTFACTTNLYLLAHNTNGTASKMASLKLYGCKIYDGGVLIHDLRPCIDSGGVVCLYDEVSKTYFRNAGTGEFIAGNELVLDVSTPTGTSRVFFTRRGAVPKLPTVWQKYNVATTYTQKTTNTSSSSVFVTGGTGVAMGSSYSFNSSTGKFTIGGSTTVALSGEHKDAETYRYVAGVANSSKVCDTVYTSKGIYIDPSYGASWNVGMQAQNNYMITLMRGDGYGINMKCISCQSTTSRGTYIEDVISPDESAYPEDGIQDGYWYVKIS